MTEEALADLERMDLVARVWARDHTAWKPDPTEIADRLGWLDVARAMQANVPDLQAFAEEARSEGIRHVVLLGMGGSSLGPEVVRQTFGSASGYPELIVLDSTVPDTVMAVTREIDTATTLFSVSSKSGTTTEPLALYAHFRALVESAVGAENAGRNFFAITDAGTPLEAMARDNGFRRAFLNPADIGGRYSVLSYFGLAPSALTGLDVAKLLDRAAGMMDACGPNVPVRENPAALLGAAMAGHATQGRDKLTLVTSPSIAAFGLWAEQLIAESLGKEGRGKGPVAGEPRLDPAYSGDDRLFVHLRLDGDGDDAEDAAIDAIETAGLPVVRLELRDRYDLGAEFFRWELATAIAGAVLGIHPFDQPNVQQAKDQTLLVLDECNRLGSLPDVEAPGSLAGLLSTARKGDYLSIMAYVRQTPETDNALNALRRSVAERWGIATTLGYGPRYLHSTGQVHKGGPDTGIYLLLTAEPAEDAPVPGESFSFGTLAEAQALGDLRALQALGRRVARIHLPSADAASLGKLAAESPASV
ncbi:MAG: glucose-6-phosphate isomerase [Chloroflexota bacterium]|nr:glucose-6-phosphate isomerase [Chloroflexota bacterium]